MAPFQFFGLPQLPGWTCTMETSSQTSIIFFKWKASWRWLYLPGGLELQVSFKIAVEMFIFQHRKLFTICRLLFMKIKGFCYGCRLILSSKKPAYHVGSPSRKLERAGSRKIWKAAIGHAPSQIYHHWIWNSGWNAMHNGWLWQILDTFMVGIFHVALKCFWTPRRPQKSNKQATLLSAHQNLWAIPIVRERFNFSLSGNSNNTVTFHKSMSCKGNERCNRKCLITLLLNRPPHDPLSQRK